MDNKTTLETVDDAATQIMGSDWRMPTQTEIQELLDNTDYEWITNYNDTGVNGRNFSSKINGNSIFIPAAGICSDGSVNDVGDYGCVWSSSLYSSYLAFYLDSVYSEDPFVDNFDYRCKGFSVRGVRK